jgi:hypothetical protein
MIFGRDKKFLTAQFLPYPRRQGTTRQSLSMTQNQRLPDFNLNVEEWDAKGLTYETLAICRSREMARAVCRAAERSPWVPLRLRGGAERGGNSESRNRKCWWRPHRQSPHTPY